MVTSGGAVHTRGEECKRLGEKRAPPEGYSGPQGTSLSYGPEDFGGIPRLHQLVSRRALGESQKAALELTPVE